MWFPENCTTQTHCPLLRHISKAYDQRPLKSFLNSGSHRLGRKERREEVWRHKEALASLANDMRGSGTRACEPVVTISPIPFGWKPKGTTAPPPEPLTPQLQTLPGDSYLKTWSSLCRFRVPTLQEGDQREQLPQIQDGPQAHSLCVLSIS